MTDEYYMRKALNLAEKGCGYTSPNPMVGAIVVKNGEIIGSGYHKRYGDLHAERNALADCRESAEGATIYVTLEPCCHFGKTPPCTEAIINNGIKRVVIGSPDPNPLVAGKGVKILKEHNIEVLENVLRKECDSLNEVFLYYIQNNQPFVVMKYAMTMDGKIATKSGKSKWITGEKARENVQRSRMRYSAIMVGIGTVLADNPMLTCRIPGGRNPIRIICDTSLRTPFSSNIVKTANDVKTIIATACTDKAKHEEYIKRGCEIIAVPKKDGHIDLEVLIKELGERKIDSILLEGGGELNWSALNSGIVNKVQAYIAPKLFGGAAKSPIMGVGIDSTDKAFILSSPIITKLGDDVLLESEVIKCSPELLKKPE